MQDFTDDAVDNSGESDIIDEFEIPSFSIVERSDRMAEIRKHSLDGSNEEAVKKMRQLLKDLEHEKKRREQLTAHSSEQHHSELHCSGCNRQPYE